MTITRAVAVEMTAELALDAVAFLRAALANEEVSDAALRHIVETACYPTQMIVEEPPPGAPVAKIIPIKQ